MILSIASRAASLSATHATFHNLGNHIVVLCDNHVVLCLLLVFDFVGHNFLLSSFVSGSATTPVITVGSNG